MANGRDNMDMHRFDLSVLNSSLWTSVPVGGRPVDFIPLAFFLAGLGG